MKRAQSVEVLSILAEASPRPHRAQQTSTGDEDDEEAEEETFYQASGPPPQESPPPLPPRERDSTPPVLNVLHSSPALVNDSLVLVEKKATTPSSRPTAKSTSVSTTVKQKTGGGRQPSPRQSASSRQPASPRQPPSNAKKSSQNRPSAGLLFGVKDKELPAPDTVKETRKLFESGGGAGGGRRFGKSSGGLTKSKSTSSLYTRPNSRSNSQEKPGLGMARKKSEEDLHRSAVTHKSRTGSSPARRTPSSSSSSTARKTPGRVSSPGRSSTSSPAPRPSIPAKPSHLSPSTRPSPYRRTANSPSQPPLPARASAPGVVKATPANVVPTTTTSKTSNSSRARPVLEEGVKRISQESIENIRSDGNVFNINVDEKTSGAKSHLPGSVQESKYSQPKQVRDSTYIPLVSSLFHQNWSHYVQRLDYHLRTVCCKPDGLPHSISCTSHEAT